MNAAGSKPRDHDQWTAALLLGRDPLSMDPLEREAKTEEPVEPGSEEQARGMRAWMAQAEAQIRATGHIRIEGDPT